MTDEVDIEHLEREIPALSSLKAFADSMVQVNWFAQLGERYSPAVTATATAYLDLLGFPDTDIALIENWGDAVGAAETYDWSNPAWEAEELARADLTSQALELMSEEALQLGLSMLNDKASHAAKSALVDSAALWDMVDEDTFNLSIGSVVQTVYGTGLTLLAAAANPEIESEDHVFVRKFNLFELGRWPISITGQTFNLF